jgi:hypothetical protein
MVIKGFLWVPKPKTQDTHTVKPEKKNNITKYLPQIDLYLQKPLHIDTHIHHVFRKKIDLSGAIHEATPQICPKLD